MLATLSCMAQRYPDQRPAASDRLFTSAAVEQTIATVAPQLKNPKLQWMFRNCFPNTLDTTVHFDSQTGLTFVYTGDIPAMWLRDSGAQVWPYVDLAPQDPELQAMIAGVIKQQFKLICIDPYANAFNHGPTGEGAKDDTGTPQNPWVFERKWEIDSHCYPVRLAYHYWKVTGDTSIFDEVWLETIGKILNTFKEQQRKDGDGPYYFLRVTDRQL
ncbi:MAG: glycoside hydrolase family 125 protein, partial [Bacteroidales bacterium]|nr:glycoside hydrolase family 125 protein [Bacteroidales bacterium]